MGRFIGKELTQGSPETTLTQVLTHSNTRELIPVSVSLSPPHPPRTVTWEWPNHVHFTSRISHKSKPLFASPSPLPQLRPYSLHLCHCSKILISLSKTQSRLYLSLLKTLLGSLLSTGEGIHSSAWYPRLSVVWFLLPAPASPWSWLCLWRMFFYLEL